MSKASDKGLVALVTGANKGIGLEIARQLGERGITVLIGARDPQRGMDARERLRAEGIAAHVVELDVTSQPSLDRAAGYVSERFGKLDILVNNAGIYLEEKPPSGNDEATFMAIYETNVFGVMRATKTMLPLIRESAQGRIVNVSSSLGSLALNGDPEFEFAPFLSLGYNSSKTAVNAMTVFFANELRGTSVKINAADPGYCATEMNGFSGTKSARDGAKVAVRLAVLPADGPSGGFFNDAGSVPW
ncbi:SDR family oxidoreductase [Cohnella sp. GCM10027633]|uniref:SDR family oxidoreductase n=1 Tax=unclassified Cohnella TaxID=2636738 RepID=UPI00363A7A85